MSDFLDWSTLIYRAPALLIAMALHEYAHAYVSDSLGDPTPSMQGRLTANPLVHLDMVGLMLLVICGFGWAKPVEIIWARATPVGPRAKPRPIAAARASTFHCFAIVGFMDCLSSCLGQPTPRSACSIRNARRPLVPQVP